MKCVYYTLLIFGCIIFIYHKFFQNSFVCSLSDNYISKIVSECDFSLIYQIGSLLLEIAITDDIRSCWLNKYLLGLICKVEVSGRLMFIRIL